MNNSTDGFLLGISVGVSLICLAITIALFIVDMQIVSSAKDRIDKIEEKLK